MARWKDTEGGEVTIFEAGEGPSGIPDGALVVDGNKVVIVFPVPALAGGWTVRTTLWCEGYESITRCARACFGVLPVAKRSIVGSHLVGGAWSRLRHHRPTNAKACGLGNVEHTASLRSLDGLLNVVGNRISSELFDTSDGEGGPGVGVQLNQVSYEELKTMVAAASK